MKPIRRKPMRDPIRRFRDEMDSMMERFDRFFKEPFFSDTLSIFERDSFTPACNIEELDDRYKIIAEMPGVDPDNIEIELDDYSISIKGQREEKLETKDEGKQMHMVEHSYGSYYRSFTLPENIDADNISAEYKNGILTIDIPKTQDTNKRKISIKKSD